MLVSDIESYPEFIPGCIDAKVLSTGDDWLEARLTIRKIGFEHSFVTRNTMNKNESITLKLVEGPFKAFSGLWKFTPVGDSEDASPACRVSFDLRYEFKSRLLAMAGNKIFEHLASEQVSTLSARAKEVYSNE